MVSSKSGAPRAFSAGDTVVYPSHGVGTVSGIEEQEIAGIKLELLVLSFEKERMTVRLPKAKVATSGLRPVMDAGTAAKVLDVLSGRPKRSRDLWARRAQGYEGKINSGDVISLAEVVRDLNRSGSADAASFSERGIYENALERLVPELALSLDKSETEVLALMDARLDRRPAAGAQDDDAGQDAAAA